MSSSQTSRGTHIRGVQIYCSLSCTAKNCRRFLFDCRCFLDVDISATSQKAAPLNKALVFSMPNIGGIGGWIERFQPCEGTVKSPWFLCVYSLPTSCWSSVALSWKDPFPQHHGWHFPYLWSASQGSWLLQQHLLNNNGQNIKSFYSCYVAATTEMKPFLLKGLNTVRQQALAQWWKKAWNSCW